MALFDFNVSTNMAEDSPTFFGLIVEASGTRFVISDGYFTNVYEGLFFYSGIGWPTLGVVNSVTAYLGLEPLATIRDISFDVVTFGQYVAAGRTADLLAQLMGGSDIVRGSNFQDLLLGYGGADSIYGFGGNDVIAPGLSGFVTPNYVDGGAGLDVVAFYELGAGYSFARVGNVWHVDAPYAAGMNDLVAVERVAFLDRTVALDLEGNAGMAYRLYQAAFDRTPDQAGLSYWVREMDGGMPFGLVAASFIISEEFKAAYGDPKTLSNSDFLDILYENILGRVPDAGGKDYWTGELERGMGRELVLASFSESIENQQLVGVAISGGIILDPF